MLLVANFVNTKWCKKTFKMTEILAHGHSSDSTQRELSNENQHDRVQMIFQILCILVLWTKLALALEGLTFRPAHMTICQKYHMISHRVQISIKTNFHPSI